MLRPYNRPEGQKAYRYARRVQVINMDPPERSSIFLIEWMQELPMQLHSHKI